MISLKQIKHNKGIYGLHSTRVDNNHLMTQTWNALFSEIILGIGSVNKRRRYIVTLSPIGRAHRQNDP